MFSTRKRTSCKISRADPNHLQSEPAKSNGMCQHPPQYQTHQPPTNLSLSPLPHFFLSSCLFFLFHSLSSSLPNPATLHDPFLSFSSSTPSPLISLFLSSLSPYPLSLPAHLSQFWNYEYFVSTYTVQILILDKMHGLHFPKSLNMSS